MLSKNKTILSIIILNYNTKYVALDCIASLEKNYNKELTTGIFQIILVDNGSPDGSLKEFQKYQKKSKTKLFNVIDSGGNIGFAKGNNKGIPYAKGNYVLFLNPDTVVYPNTLTNMISFMVKTPDAGAATCKVLTPDGSIDEASHRGFPTPWNAFTHFSKLEKLFPYSKIFAGYTRGWENMQITHKTPAIVGAFLFVRREAGEKIGWWDEDYFFYGEDLQFCYDLEQAGFAVYYVPTGEILHLGGISSGIKKHSQHITTADTATKKMVQKYRFDAMRIFYKKNYSHHHPIVSWLVIKGIDILERKYS